MGTGSGIIAIEAAKNSCIVTAVDVNRKALMTAKSNAKKSGVKINFVLSHLFEKVKEKFDVIVFNPPYLPAVRPFNILPKDVRIAVEGGKNGYEAIIKFLKKAKRFLNDDGVIFLLFSSLTNKRVIDNYLKKQGYIKKLVAKEKLFFETIYVYEIKMKK